MKAPLFCLKMLHSSYFQNKGESRFMNILVTLDENYLDPLRTMLWSLHQAEPDTSVTLWLIHSRMRPDALETVRSYCDGFGWDFCPCEAGEELFADAPVFRH